MAQALASQRCAPPQLSPKGQSESEPHPSTHFVPDPLQLHGTKAQIIPGAQSVSDAQVAGAGSHVPHWAGASGARQNSGLPQSAGPRQQSGVGHPGGGGHEPGVALASRQPENLCSQVHSKQ